MERKPREAMPGIMISPIGHGQCRPSKLSSMAGARLASELERLAALTLERIRRDKRRAPAHMYPLLAYLEGHLFDADLSANRLKVACGITDNNFALCFHSALSLPPYAYIEDCRMEVGCRLLRETDLKIWKIAQLLGYSTLQVFSRAFERWSGFRPRSFRTRVTSPLTVPFDILVKTAHGALEKSEADELSRHLAKLYPTCFRWVPQNDGDDPLLIAPEFES